MRTRKISVLLTDDAAAQYDMLVARLGIGSQYRKQADIDAAMLITLLEQYSALVAAHSLATGKTWCNPADLIAFREAALRDANCYRLKEVVGSGAEGEGVETAESAECSS